MPHTRTLLTLAAALLTFPVSGFTQETAQEVPVPPRPDLLSSESEREQNVLQALPASPSGRKNMIDELLRQRAEELDRVEKERDAFFRQRAQLLLQREKLIGEREKAIGTREAELLSREAALLKREGVLAARESAVTTRESTLGIKEATPLPVEKPKWNAPSIVGKYACVIDAVTGTVLHEKAADQKVAVASTQKLMTAFLVVEAGDLDKMVTIEASDTHVEPTIIGVKAGQQYSRRELVKALLVRSGNDIARVLARDNAGSVEAFAEKMNTRALALGMSNSNFVNPHGLTATGQGSTARDMAILARACYADPFIRECTQIKSDTFKFTDGSSRALTNTNKLLDRYSPCNGMKTGYTRASGNCLISSAESNGRARIVVVLGSNGTWIWKDSQVLLEWAMKS